MSADRICKWHNAPIGPNGECTHNTPQAPKSWDEGWKDRAEAATQEVERLNGIVENYKRVGMEQSDEITSLRSQLAEMTAKFQEADKRHFTFMISGGPVVMASEYDKLKARAEAAESQLAELKTENERLPEEIKKIADYCRLSLRVKEPIAERYEIQLNERIVLCNWLLEFAGRGEAAEQEQNKAGVGLEGKVGLSTSSAQEGTASKQADFQKNECVARLAPLVGRDAYGAIPCGSCTCSTDELTAALARSRKLEEYAQHKLGCRSIVTAQQAMSISMCQFPELYGIGVCSCGLSDLLGDKP